MASYIVDTSQVLTTTTGADSVWIQSGGAGSSEVVLLGGNDTVSMEGISNNSSLGTVIRASDGNDTITITSAEFSAGNIAIYGGAGNDTITISGGNAAILNTNEDNDLVIATGGTTISAATFSTGADILRMSGTIDQLGMGNGHDTVSGSVVTVLTGGSITLGDGRDTLQVTTMTGVSAVSILGDNGANFNADLIDFSVGTGMNGLTLKGQGGNDTIVLSGAQASSLIQGNAGDDSISLSATLTNGLEVGAGKGNDTIYLDEGFAGSISADVIGGLGNDSIFINLIAASGTDATAINLIGGAGSDTITFDTTQSGSVDGEIGTLVLSSLGDSTLGSLDLFQLQSGAGGVSNEDRSGSTLLTVNFSNSASVTQVGVATAAGRFANATSFATINAQGIIDFTGQLQTDSQSSVTAAMVGADAVTVNQGAAALFSVNSVDYLFMQGGTAGIADDSLIQLNAGSAKSIAVQGSAIVVTFSGT
jgi:hypothetical protein